MNGGKVHSIGVELAPLARAALAQHEQGPRLQPLSLQGWHPLCRGGRDAEKTPIIKAVCSRCSSEIAD